MVKDLALSLLWRGFNPWPGNLCVPCVLPTNPPPNFFFLALIYFELLLLFKNDSVKKYLAYPFFSPVGLSFWDFFLQYVPGWMHGPPRFWVFLILGFDSNAPLTLSQERVLGSKRFRSWHV